MSPRTRYTPVPLEREEQVAVIRWATLHEARYPELKLLYHVPNAGNKHINYAVSQKRQGLKSGVPDLVLPVARGGYHGLYLELKRRCGGAVSSTQKAWLAALDAEGYKTAVAHGWEAARDILLDYLEAT